MTVRALDRLQSSWLFSLTILAIGVGVLMQSLPDLSSPVTTGSWRPEGTRVRGSWSPISVASARTVGPRAQIPTWEPIPEPGNRAQRAAPRVPPPSPGPEDQPKSPPTEPRAESSHVGIAKYRVARGDRYWTLAERYLGRGDRWREIQELNPDVSPAALVEGTIIRIPVPRGSVIENGKIVKTGGEGAITPSGRSTPARLPDAKPWTHRVRAGESLSQIGTRYYTDGDWRRIFEANRDRLKHPHRVEKGMVLVIPRAPGKERRR